MPHRLFCHLPLNTPLRFTLFLACALIIATTARADNKADMQKRLNEENAQSSFAIQDIVSIEKDVESSLQKGLKPKTTAPEDWQPGYNCDTYYGRSNRYNYNGYRDCLHHYRYYGRYW